MWAAPTGSYDPDMTGEAESPPSGMVAIPGGTTRIGCERFYPEEGPVREVAVDPFYVDARLITVKQFSRFVRETGHVTVAEIAPDPKEYPDATGTPGPRLARLPAFTGADPTARCKRLVGVGAGRPVAASARPGQRRPPAR